MAKELSRRYGTRETVNGRLRNTAYAAGAIKTAYCHFRSLKKFPYNIML